MGRAPCCEKVGLKKGRWTAEEDEILVKYIQANGEGSWRSLPKNAGLKRCGKSCRLRWINYLRADLKRGNISAEEQDIIMKLHKSMGNRWSLIAGYLPGRTDNEIKNYWNSHLSRRIDCFRRPISTPGEALQILMDPSPKMGRAGTKRGSSARKSQVSNANVATEEIEKDAVVQDEVSINKSIVSDCSEVEGEERESLSSGSHKEGGSGLSMGPSENTTEDLMLSPNEERQQEILGEELEFDVLFLDEVLSDSLHSNKDDDGMLMSSQCIKESEDRESGLEKDTVVQDEVSINKSIASDGPEVEGEERESLSSGSHKEGGSGPIMGPSESATEDLTLSPNEERQQEFLGEELEFDVLFLDELLSDNLQSNKDDDGVLMSSLCIKESDDRESGPALSSNGENVGWYSFSPIASCFEEDWAKWDMWESAFDQCDDQKQLCGFDHRGENLELLHSWLWDSDH